MEKEEEAMEKVEAIGSKQRQRKRQNTMGQNRKLDAQRQYMVIGTLALLLIILCDLFM